MVAVGTGHFDPIKIVSLVPTKTPHYNPSHTGDFHEHSVSTCSAETGPSHVL